MLLDSPIFSARPEAITRRWATSKSLYLIEELPELITRMIMMSPPCPITQAILEVDDNSSLNLAAMHARENVVNVVERFRGDGRLDFAFAGEVQSFLQIEAGSFSCPTRRPTPAACPHPPRPRMRAVG